MEKKYEKDETSIHVRWKDLIDHLPGGLGVYYLYPNDHVELEYLNDAFYRIMDSTREEWTAYAGGEALHSLEPLDRELLVAKLREAVLGDGSENVNQDVRVRMKNGHYRWLNVQATVAERMPEKTALYLLYTNAELRREAEIRYEREVRLRKEMIKDSAVYYRINLSSGMVEELFSETFDTTAITFPIPMETLIKMGLFNGVYEKDQKHLLDVLDLNHMRKNYDKGKSMETFYYRRILPQKGLCWLKASIIKLKRVSSDDVIAFFTAIDVDDEKKDLILLRDVMNEEIESLITLKRSTGKIRILKETQTLPGYDPNEPYSGYFYFGEDFINGLFSGMLPEDVEQARDFISMDRIRTELEHKEIHQGTYRTRNEDGSIRRKKVRVFYLDETKDDIIFVRRDITDLYNEQQRQSAALKRAMDETRAANEAKSVFLSRMSHDMRTPLNAIIGYSGPVLREGATTRQKEAFLDDIHSSGEYLLGIINDVLDISKIESGKMVLHPEAYTLKAFRDNMETVISPLCAKKGIHFEISLPEDGGMAYLLDRVRFNQIFINILSNAVKFTPAGGNIAMRAQRELCPDGKWEFVFEVADTGCGMSEEYLPHIFESFSQEYAEKSVQNEPGTGLGLSIVKQLVEQMGGCISVSSSQGEGSTFFVEMPIFGADGRQERTEFTFPKNGLKGVTLLLCEDHPMNRDIAVMLLEKEGCIVDTAEDGQRGLNLFQDSSLNQYDAILMDIRMPGMDGLEAAKAIRALPRRDAETIPIIAMTGNAFVEDRRASEEAGMNAHLSKPIDPIEMYRILYQLVFGQHMDRTPKIIVVDDIEMNAALVARALKGHYETIIALSAREALEELQKNPYIIAVITDVQMPEMDGGELIRMIRNNPAYDHIALIANTEFGKSRVEEKLMQDGADDFIYKPTAPSVILSRVRNVLGKYR